MFKSNILTSVKPAKWWQLIGMKQDKMEHSEKNSLLDSANLLQTFTAVQQALVLLKEFFLLLD